MKKVLSIMMAFCMFVTMMTAVSVSAADEKVEIIMDQAGVDASVGKVTSTGGVGWTLHESDAFYGGSAVKATYSNTTYEYRFYPKLDAGWYDVYTYYGWAVVDNPPVGIWGDGNWKLDNGLGETGSKAPVTMRNVDGWAETKYMLEEGWDNGWYKLGTVYFSGVYEKDSVIFKQTTALPVVDAIKIVTSDYQPEPDDGSIIMEQNCTDETLGKITSSGGIGVGWTVNNNAAFSGGSAYRSVNDSNYHVTFWPKVNAGWYDVYTYYGWTMVEGGPTAWGAGTWKIDNGLGVESGDKAPVSKWLNDGLAKSTYSQEEGWENGWYKISTVYFSGVYEQDYVKFTRGADMPYVDAIKIVAADYQPEPEPEPEPEPDDGSIIMEQSGVDEAVGNVTSTGGVGWTEYTSDIFSGGSAVRATYSDTNYTYSFLPKVNAGWYDVYTYYGWVLEADRPFGPWGAGQWTLDNSLGATGNKAAVSTLVNDGLASGYTLENGWYKLGTVYFSGVFGNDKVVFKQTANLPVVDAIKIKPSDYDPDTIIMDDAGVDASIGKVTYTGGTNWTKLTNEKYYGGTAMQHPNYTSDYTYNFYPKLEAGWYDVHLYKNWTCWGAGTWTADNGLGETGAKAPISKYMNLGLGEDNFPTVDGWYKLGTVYFSGVYEKDRIYFKFGANMPVVDAVKITKSDYDPNVVIIDEAESESSKGKVTKSGTWTTTAGDTYYGGSVLKAPNEGSPSVTFLPKLEAGWYEVYTYKNWTIWGSATYTITNGLGLTGSKADMSGSVNSGATYTNLKDGWYGLGLVYFSGVYQQDKVTFTRTAGTQAVDAVKFVKSDFDPENFIMDEAAIDALPGRVNSNGTWETVQGDQYYGGSVKKHAPYEQSYYYTEFYPRVDEGFYTVYMYRNWGIYGAADYVMTNGLGLEGAKTDVTGNIITTSTYAENDGWYTIGTVYFGGNYGQDRIRFTKTIGRVAIDAIKIVKGVEADYPQGVGVLKFDLTREDGLRMPTSFAKKLTPLVTLDLHRTAEDMQDVKIVISEYSAKNRLVDTDTKVITSDDIELYEKKRITFSKPLVGEEGTVKAFVWIGETTPLTQNISYGKSDIFSPEIMEEEISYELAKDVLKNATEYYADYSVHNDQYDIDAIFYEGSIYNGERTKVFAYMGIPKNASAENPVPAVVCVHGGNGSANIDWVKKWNDKGYAAIAMDLYGNGPENGTNEPNDNTGKLRHPYAGPLPWKYGTAPYTDYNNIGMYHVVHNVIYAHNLLRSNPCVDAEKTGITGISWGGITTTTVMGIDNRFSFAAPIYGCGYLDECRTYFNTQFGDDQIRKLWDPSNFAANAKMPVLFTNSDSDEHFSVNSSSLTYGVTENAYLSIRHRYGHSQNYGMSVEQVYTFADRVLSGREDLFIRVDNAVVADGVMTIQYTEPSDLSLANVKLYYLKSSDIPYGGGTSKVDWTLVETYEENDGVITIQVPEEATYCYASLTDNEGNIISTEFIKIK